MGKPVTLDSDVVEALLVAAEYTGKIEDMFNARQDDPQAIRTKPKIRECVDIARQEWGSAIREISPDEGRQPDEAEVEVLRHLYKDDMALAVNQVGVSVDIDWLYEQQRNFPTHLMMSLRTKRLVVAGQVSTVIKWGDKSIKAQPEMYQIYKLTDLGRAWCRANLK